jgi:hypothetical protein
VADVQVSIPGREVKSNAQGYFAIENLAPTDRLILNFKKAGFVASTEITKVRAGEGSYLNAVVATERQGQALSNRNSGTVTSDRGASVTIPPDSLVNASTGEPYAGTAIASVTPFDPTTPEGFAAFPGKFEGLTRGGETVPIRSFGFMDITLRDEAGNLLNLAPGQFATIRVPIAENLKTEAPTTIPLWYFEEASGQWKEEGELTKDGDIYESQIPHFSPWNCDQRMITCLARGRVVDCAHSNTPIKGASVHAEGPGWGSGEDSTGDEGKFAFLIPADADLEIWASKNGADSEKKTIHSCRPNEETNVGDICLQSPKLKMVLTWGETPLDLDAHLTFPKKDSDSRGHIYFQERTSEAVKLDTDDTNSFGPEIISVYDLVDGTYRYSVHHFNGTGTITQSSAALSLIVDGLGLFSLKPPANADHDHDLWRAWDIRVQNGKVTGVSNVNDVINTMEYSRAEHFNP